MDSFTPVRRLSLFIGALLWPLAATAAPTLVIAVHAKPAARAAFTRIIDSEQRARLDRWQHDGVISGYRLFVSRYADDGLWDAMEILTFKDDGALARWSRIERGDPAGLPPAATAAIETIETTPVDTVRSGGAGPDPTQAALVIPYQALIPAGPYLTYLDGYTLPQFNGWIADGALAGFEVMTSRFPAGRAWNALIVLRYRDDAALARRDAVVAATRARLAADPAWTTFSDSKKAVRTEGRLAIADIVASSPPVSRP